MFPLAGALRTAASIAILSLAIAAFAHPAPTHADAIFVVDSTSDAVDATPGDGACATAGGSCTLRAAIMETNALFGHDTVQVPAGTYTLTLPDSGSDNDGANGDLDISAGVTIAGAGKAATVIDAGFLDRAFQVSGGIATEMSGLTIRHGNTPFQGGGIASGGSLTLENVLVEGNYAVSDGGGVHTTGALTVVNSEVAGNTAERDGGGIYAGATSTLSVSSSVISTNAARGGGGLFTRAPHATLIDTTVTDNDADDGGGAVRNEGTVQITGSTLSGNTAGNNAGAVDNIGTAIAINSTVSGNASGNHAGGILNAGELELANITIADNEATFAGAIENTGDATLHNTILDRGLSGANCLGAFTSLGHNISRDDSCNASLTADGDISETNPLLGPLSNNGGPTQTHALLEGSPAIDAGDDEPCPDTDQRGVARPQGAACDIGAFESGGSPPVILRWGDLDCDGEISTRDNQALLRQVLQQNALSQTEPCPNIGTTVNIDGTDRTWGDLDCDGAVSTRDNQAELRHVLQQNALSQTEPCPDIGDELD